MAEFKSTFQGRLFTSKFKKILAVCVASDGNVENEAYLYTPPPQYHTHNTFSPERVLNLNWIQKIKNKVRK
jgi:hypothetical protein